MKFTMDPVKIIEDFMMSPKADKIIADVIGSKIGLETRKEGNTLYFDMYYGKYKISEESVDLTID